MLGAAEIRPIEPGRVMPARKMNLSPGVPHVDINTCNMRFILTIFSTFLVSGFLIGQNVLSGSVVNDAGEALIGASVFIPDTEHATTTDSRGHFKLPGLKDGAYTLKCTYLGYADVTRSIVLMGDEDVEIRMEGTIYNIDQITIRANQLSDADPFTFKSIAAEDIEVDNIGLDMPFLLNENPNIVVTSDAGTGIGYTGMRIRGTDGTRINVTINGVPLNDAESQAVFWVDLPDFASSLDNIQIQNGVGTSTNGAGAFGATIGLNTDHFTVNPYVAVSGTLGSFATRKINVRAGTGLMNGQYSINARYSLINSDGWVDRAFADLNAFSLSASRISENNSLTFNVFSGMERTYQSWYGAPQARVENDTAALLNHYYNNLGILYLTPADSINLFQSGRSYNYYTYPDQVDDYRQTHYQLIYNQALGNHGALGITGHYTRGLGYFEEFRYMDLLAFYGLQNEEDEQGNTVTNADLVRRRWLDNHFYGTLMHLKYKAGDDLDLTLGGAFHRYNGDHYGRIVNHAFDPDVDKQRNYYFNEGNKSDVNFYGKMTWEPWPQWRLFGDMQWRHVSYSISGDDNDIKDVGVDYSKNFLNPKVGLSYIPGPHMNAYASFAVANREPDRNDFINRQDDEGPVHETLYDLELGYRLAKPGFALDIAFYNMSYDNQLVLTGALNDVGAPLRFNVANSVRRGVEISGQYALSDRLNMGANVAVSQNKIDSFDEVLYDYTNGFDIVVNTYSDTDIAFSPGVVAGGSIDYTFPGGIKADLTTKYVGSQYLDNTSNPGRVLDAYAKTDLILSWEGSVNFMKSLRLSMHVMNVFDIEYAPNGYTYSYIFGDLVTENYLYPQAGRHFFISAAIDF